MKSTQYLLYIAGTFRLLTASEAQFLIKTSSNSRNNRRYPSLPSKPLRESMTISGRHLFSGFTVRVEVHLDLHHLLGRIWLLTVTVVSGIESGAPSASRPDGVPPTFRPRALGTFMAEGPHVHIKLSPSATKVSQMERDGSRSKVV